MKKRLQKSIVRSWIFTLSWFQTKHSCGLNECLWDANEGKWRGRSRSGPCTCWEPVGRPSLPSASLSSYTGFSLLSFKSRTVWVCACVCMHACACVHVCVCLQVWHAEPGPACLWLLCFSAGPPAMSVWPAHSVPLLAQATVSGSVRLKPGRQEQSLCNAWAHGDHWGLRERSPQKSPEVAFHKRVPCRSSVRLSVQFPRR